MNRVIMWLRAQSMQRQIVLTVMVAVTICCVALPLSLHKMSLARIREATFDAIRFAASSPEQLRTLPVTGWRDGPKIAAPHIQKIGWEQYQMSLPHGETSTIIDIDLRSTLLPLMLGFGGWLRIAAMVVMTGIVSFFLWRSCRGWCAIIPPPLNETLPLTPTLSPKGRGWNPSSQDPSRHNDILNPVLNHIPQPAFYFDTHHQLAHWNDAAQTALPHMALAAGIHVLDLSAHLPWGAELVEKMDEVAQQSALIIHKGDSLCVIPG